MGQEQMVAMSELHELPPAGPGKVLLRGCPDFAGVAERGTQLSHPMGTPSAANHEIRTGPSALPCPGRASSTLKPAGL